MQNSKFSWLLSNLIFIIAIYYLIFYHEISGYYDSWAHITHWGRCTGREQESGELRLHWDVKISWKFSGKRHVDLIIGWAPQTLANLPDNPSPPPSWSRYTSKFDKQSIFRPMFRPFQAHEVSTKAKSEPKRETDKHSSSHIDTVAAETGSVLWIPWV